MAPLEREEDEALWEVEVWDRDVVQFKFQRRRRGRCITRVTSEI